MNIARIVRIEPDGKPFTTTNGTFYPYVVGFDDHRSGQANSKSNPPPWKVGEVVGYDVTGQTPRGADKFKITRNPDPKMGTFTGQPEADRSNPDLEAAQPRYAPGATRTPPPAQTPRQSSQNAGNSLPVNLPHGATVGGGLARAVDIWLACYKGAPWDEEARTIVFNITRDLVDIQTRIERGEPMTGGDPY